MNEARDEKLSKLAIAPERKNRGRGGPAGFIVVLLLLLLALAGGYFYMKRIEQGDPSAAMDAAMAAPNAAPAAPVRPGDAVLTVSGYVIPRQRIEISPKFIGTVKTISIKKGDRVKAGDVLVTLEDDEHRARVTEAEGRVKMAEANLANAVIQLGRQTELAKINAESERALDAAKHAHALSLAELHAARGSLDLARTYLGWCTIHAPIDGVILEKMVNPNELVTPQSFGGAGGPRTAFLAMADLDDLQVEIDLNEADTPKVFLNQSCRVSPEAYPEKKYEGRVAEIAPEANRSKGTLQIKVQVKNPDAFLTPELSARVDFLAGEGAK